MLSQLDSKITEDIDKVLQINEELLNHDSAETSSEYQNYSVINDNLQDGLVLVSHAIVGLKVIAALRDVELVDNIDHQRIMEILSPTVMQTQTANF